MRKSIALFILLALGGCGGEGGDVTTPGGGLTLTVSGQGTGGGHVATGSGSSPAVDCTLTSGGGASGACTVSGFSDGAVVALSVTPAGGSRFDGWGGDASDCGPELSCSLTMNGNKTATAMLSAIPAVEIISSAYYSDPNFAGEGGILWVVEVRNPSPQWIELAEIDFTSHDQSGTVLTTSATFVGPIPPGETRAGRGVADYFGNEASVDFVVADAQAGTEDPRLAAARITSSNWSPDEGGGTITWTVEVENVSTTPIEEAQVDFVTYDAAGKIVDVASTFMGPIPAGGRLAQESLADFHGTEANTKFQVASVR